MSSHNKAPATGSPQASLRRIRRVAHMPRLPRGAGFDVALLHADVIDGGMDPFLQIDAFALSEPFFGPHPHAGFCAVTYILPESPLGFINRDSLCNRQRIGPGALHWTTAGRGVQHEEVPEKRGVAVLGLQMFINLPAAMKHIEPGFIHLEPGQMPVWEAPGVRARVVFGDANGVPGTAPTPTPGARLVDVEMAPDASFELTLPANDNCFVWLFAGSADALTPEGVQPLATFDLVGYEMGGERIGFRAGEQGARLAVCGGPPLNEPVVASGPFVMNTAEQIQAAIASYRRGEMGQLSKTVYDADGQPT